MCELIQGAVGELGNITMWGSRGRERNRSLQVASFIFFLLLYTTVILLSLLYPPDEYVSNPIMYHNLRVTALCCGCLSIPIFLLQIFLMDKNKQILTKLTMNKHNHTTYVQCRLTKLRTLASVN